MNAITYTEKNYVRLALLSLIIILMAACASPTAQDSTPIPENTPVLSEQTPEIAADESGEGPGPEPVEDAAAPEVEPPIPATIPLIIDSNGEIQNADRLPSEIDNLAERVDEAINLLGDLLTDVESEENGRPTYQQVAFLIVTGDSLEDALQWRLAATLTAEGRAAYPDHGHYTFYFSIAADDGQESVRRVFAINRDLFGDFDDSLQLLTMALPATGPLTEASDDLSTHLIFTDTNGSQWVLGKLFAQHLLAQDLFVPLEPGAIAAYWTIPEAGLGIAQNGSNGAVYALSYEPDAVPQFVLEGSEWTAVQTWQIIDNTLVGWNAAEWRFEPLEQMGLSLGEGLQQFLADNPQAVAAVDPETGTATITNGDESHELVLGEGEAGEWVDIVTAPETIAATEVVYIDGVPAGAAQSIGYISLAEIQTFQESDPDRYQELMRVYIAPKQLPLSTIVSTTLVVRFEEGYQIDLENSWAAPGADFPVELGYRVNDQETLNQAFDGFFNTINQRGFIATVSDAVFRELEETGRSGLVRAAQNPDGSPRIHRESVGAGAVVHLLAENEDTPPIRHVVFSHAPRNSPATFEGADGDRESAQYIWHNGTTRSGLRTTDIAYIYDPTTNTLTIHSSMVFNVLQRWLGGYHQNAENTQAKPIYPAVLHSLAPLGANPDQLWPDILEGWSPTAFGPRYIEYATPWHEVVYDTDANSDWHQLYEDIMGIPFPFPSNPPTSPILSPHPSAIDVYTINAASAD